MKRPNQEAATTGRFGLGLLGMSGVYGATDRSEAIATIHAAIDAGVPFLDTGDFYGMGASELLLRDALRTGDRDKVQISVKFGAQGTPDGSWAGFDASPSATKSALAYTLRRLNTDYVDVYRPARLDPQVPIEETIGAIAEMVQAGYVREIGLSEVGADTIRRAVAVHPIADLQIEWSLVTRTIEGEILDTCRELGVGVTAYGVLSRGLLSGHWSERKPDPADRRAAFSRFQDGNLERNLALVERVREIAAVHGATPAQAAIAWVLSQGDDVRPIIGARRRDQLQEALGTVDLALPAEALDAIEDSLPAEEVAGDRYPEAGMRELDSEG